MDNTQRAITTATNTKTIPIHQTLDAKMINNTPAAKNPSIINVM